MNAPVPQISRRERDALYSATIADLPHVVDVVLAIGRSEYALAQVLRTRYEAELRLLDDLGWAPTVPGVDRFELTSPPRRLAHALHRLGCVSHGHLVDYLEDPAARTDAAARARVERDKLVTDVCDRLLALLAGRRSLLPPSRSWGRDAWLPRGLRRSAQRTARWAEPCVSSAVVAGSPKRNSGSEAACIATTSERSNAAK